MQAQAQDFSLATIESPPGASTDVYAGPSVFSWPRYPGASRRSEYALPMVEVFGHDGWFVSTLAGAGWNFSRNTRWQYGLRLTPQAPRYARDTSWPEAVPDIGWRIERGAFLNYCPYAWLTLMSGIRQGSGERGRGVLADTGALAGVPVGWHTTLAILASSSWANAAYAQGYFNVGAQGTNMAYEARAGQLNVNTDLLMLIDLTPRWSLTLDAGRIHYLGSALSSPLVQATSYTWFAGAEYHFH